MKSREVVLWALRNGNGFNRIHEYYPAEFWKDEKNVSKVLPDLWTVDTVKEALARDLAGGFAYVMNMNGIGASTMYEVVKMWLWILELNLADFDEYAPYGLPLFVAVSEHYNFRFTISLITSNTAKI